MTNVSHINPATADTQKFGVPDGPTPREIVELLDKHIIGQDDAKRAVAIALRNRARRRALPPEMQENIYPKNIMMIGPTGVGKTEIARRLARIEQAPFIKVEASKFTEVGYVGRDVESIIRDLVEMAINSEKSRRADDNQKEAETRAEERLLDLLLPPPSSRSTGPIMIAGESGIQISDEDNESAVKDGHNRYTASRKRMREMLRNGELSDRVVEPEITERMGNVMVGLPPGSGMDELGVDLKDMVEKMIPSRKRRKQMKVSEAFPLLLEEELEKLVDMDTVANDAIERVQQSGIVFLDEIDKIVGREGSSGPDVSRAGVQRDILPLVEGCTVFTKYGLVKTDHILFIAAGAFHGTSPADLVPELQGRFPIRVELDALEKEDFEKILTQPEHSLIKQYEALLRTEGIELTFEEEAIKTMADLASRINEEMEDIGARRLHTVIEKVLDDLSFEAPDLEEKQVAITSDMVEEKLSDIAEDTDLSKYIL